MCRVVLRQLIGRAHRSSHLHVFQHCARARDATCSQRGHGVSAVRKSEDASQWNGHTAIEPVQLSGRGLPEGETVGENRAKGRVHQLNANARVNITKQTSHEKGSTTKLGTHMVKLLLCPPLCIEPHTKVFIRLGSPPPSLPPLLRSFKFKFKFVVYCDNTQTISSL